MSLSPSKREILARKNQFTLFVESVPLPLGMVLMSSVGLDRFSVGGAAAYYMCTVG